MGKNEKLPFLKIKGTPEEIGFQHGSHFKDRVQACFDFYTKSLFQKPNFDFSKHGEAYLDLIGKYFPHYRQEIEGLARGAEMEPWQISVLNSRTEIFLQANKERLHQVSECTSLYYGNPPMLAQNWDWLMPLEELFVLLEIEREDGHRILMMTEPGIIGKIGLNNAGVGLCLNILIGKEALMGMPIHILLRMMLDCATAEEARESLRTLPMGSYSHVFLGDDSGAFYSLEFGGKIIDEVDYYQLTPIHTNHYLEGSVDDSNTEVYLDSRARMTRVRQLTSGLTECDVDRLKNILLDTQGGDKAICKDWMPIWHLKHGTVATLVLDLKKRSMHISKGQPLHSSFQEFSVK